MPPVSSLAGILDSSVATSNGSTVIGQGRTLPDVSLGSLGSSFHSANEDDGNAFTQGARRGRSPNDTTPTAQRATSSRQRPQHDVDDLPSPKLFSTNQPASALLSVSPPTSVRRTTSRSGFAEQQGSHAPRRSRYLRSNQDDSGSDGEGQTTALSTRYNAVGLASDDEDGVLGSLSLNVNQHGGGDLRASQFGSSSSKRSGRHSVLGNPGASNQMTLREQEKNVDALQKENFNLQLENHFLKERMASLAPDHLQTVVNENVKIRAELVTLLQELKKAKKLLKQQDRDLAAAAHEREGAQRSGKSRDAESRELEGMWREERQRREQLEDEVERLSNQPRSGHTDELEEQLDQARGQLDDQAEEMAKLQDAYDQTQQELERLRVEAQGMSDSIGLGRGRESRMVQKLEQENRQLKDDLEELRQGAGDEFNLYEEKYNQMRDKLAASQLEVERRDDEIDQLNAELDAKIQDHETEIQQVEAEWRDELLQAKSQVDELNYVLQEREQDLEEIRRALSEHEEQLASAREHIAELEAEQGETHDRLEETLRNIESDNAVKDSDLVAANLEVQSLGQRIYDLEEEVDELRARETDLNAELQRVDEAYEGERSHFQELVTALKEARRKTQVERDDIAAQLKREQEAHAQDADVWEQERQAETEHHGRVLHSKDQVNERLNGELEAARDRLATRDRDLVQVQNALRSVEEERRKQGDEHSAGARALEMELERLRRDLAAVEEDLDRARDELRDREEALRSRDMEVAELIDKQRDTESKLVSERQGRLNLSDKLDSMAKSAKQHEREAIGLRDRLDELEPLLTETQNSRTHLQRESERQRQERQELLLRVFKDINRFLGTDDSTTPANFTVFRDTLLQRLRSINGARTDFDKRIKETEGRMEQKLSSLKRQLDAKWRTLDAFEASVKKLEIARSQWRSRYSLKEGELDAAKSRNAELQKQLSTLRASASLDETSQLRSLTERAQNAEKRANSAGQSIAMLEQRLADQQRSSASAETKWEARVKEYEARLRAAGEKIKTEKQGGKERAQQLETQVRDLERRIEVTKKRNQRVEGVMANAAHLMEG